MKAFLLSFLFFCCAMPLWGVVSVEYDLFTPIGGGVGICLASMLLFLHLERVL